MHRIEPGNQLLQRRDGPHNEILHGACLHELLSSAVMHRDYEAEPVDDLIEHAYRMGYLYDDKEYRFLKQTRLKRKLSAPQASWKKKINRRILSKTIVQRRGAHKAR